MLHTQAKIARFKLEIVELAARRKRRELKEIAIIEELKQLKNAARMLKESLKGVVKVLKEILLLRIARTNFLDLELLANLG